MKGPEQWIKSHTPTSIGSNSLISLMLDQLYFIDEISSDVVQLLNMINCDFPQNNQDNFNIYCIIKPFHCQTLTARSCPYVPYDVHKIPENDLKINPELF